MVDTRKLRELEERAYAMSEFLYVRLPEAQGFWPEARQWLEDFDRLLVECEHSAPTGRIVTAQAKRSDGLGYGITRLSSTKSA